MLVIIPAYQPDEKLLRLVNQLRQDTPYPILVVNDGSVGCDAIFSQLNSTCTVLHHAVNRGKGAAIKTALSYVYEKLPEEEAVVTVDADGQHLVKDIVAVCEELKHHPQALVLGSRRFTGKVPFKSRAGNAITRLVFQLSTGVRVYDTQTGLRAFSRERIPEMLIEGDRYEYEINVLLNATRNHTEIREVTIDTVYINGNESSHFNPLRDAWRIYKTIFLFAASSLTSTIVDYVMVLGLSALLRPLTGKWLLIAVVTARIVSSLVNYIMNRKLVFQCKSNHSIWKYTLVAVGILLANYVLMELVVRIMPLAIGKILVELALYPLSFWLQRKYVFPGKES